MSPKMKQTILKEIETLKVEDEPSVKKLSVCHIDEQTVLELIDKGNAGNEMAVIFLAEWLYEMKHYENKYDQVFNNLKMYFA